MKLWAHWLTAVMQFRSSCSRCRIFLWFITCVAGMSVRIDLLGVTSIVRAFGLQESCYDRILDFFHGSGLNLEKLTTIWTRTVLKIVPQCIEGE